MAKEIIKKYGKIRQEKTFRKIAEPNQTKEKKQKYKYNRGHKEICS